MMNSFRLRPFFLLQLDGTYILFWLFFNLIFSHIIFVEDKRTSGLNRSFCINYQMILFKSAISWIFLKHLNLSFNFKNEKVRMFPQKKMISLHVFNVHKPGSWSSMNENVRDQCRRRRPGTFPVSKKTKLEILNSFWDRFLSRDRFAERVFVVPGDVTHWLRAQLDDEIPRLV